MTPACRIGTGAAYDLSVWKPSLPSDGNTWNVVGDFAVSGYSQPNVNGILVSAESPDDIATPLNMTRVWDDRVR
jgi:hypothetical protein